MQPDSIMLITLGSLLLFGLLAEFVGKNTRFPRVTLLILLGFSLGSSGFDLIPKIASQLFHPITIISLSMIGFILGGKLTITSLKQYGRFVIIISITAVITTIIVMTLGLIPLGINFPVALLFGCIACATDPASTTDVVHELKSHTSFSKILLDIVAIDDAWALIAFSFALVSLNFFINTTQPLITTISYAARDLFGALFLGMTIGIPAAYLSGRIRPGEPILVEALGLIFLTAGLSLLFHVSYLLASMMLGFVITNLASHHTRPFHAIENIESPFLIIFFILAGASLSTPDLSKSSIVLIGYIILRIISKLAGGYLGAKWSNTDTITRKWIGVALLPQAGVAVGISLLIIQLFPETEEYLLPVVLGSTIIFEIFGPLLTRKAIIATTPD